MFKSTLIAGIGGFVGTCLRFLSEKLGALICNGTFPLGTFMANIVGCFLIGLFYGWATKTTKMSKSMNLFLITGLCGGFTTFSSMSDELVNMIEQNDLNTFFLYLVSSLVLGLLMVVLGIACIKKSETTETAQS